MVYSNLLTDPFRSLLPVAVPFRSVGRSETTSCWKSIYLFGARVSIGRNVQSQSVRDLLVETKLVLRCTMLLLLLPTAFVFPCFLTLSFVWLGTRWRMFWMRPQLGANSLGIVVILFVVSTTIDQKSNQALHSADLSAWFLAQNLLSIDVDSAEFAKNIEKVRCPDSRVHRRKCSVQN